MILKEKENYDEKTHQCKLYDFPHSLVHLDKEDYQHASMISLCRLM